MTSDYEMVCRELAVVERQLYRARCRVKCLEAKLTRIEPSEFDELMDKLEAAKRRVEECRGQYEHLRHWKAASDFREQEKTDTLIEQVRAETRRSKHHVHQ